jgi:hypothetical protein
MGFSGGYGPRINRLTGSPLWVVAVEVAAFLLLVAGLVAASRRRRGPAAAKPLFGYLGGWAAGLALMVGLAVFVKARHDLRTFGLDANGVEDPFAGTEAALTRANATRLAVVDGFLSFIGMFAVTFLIAAFVGSIIRMLTTAVTSLLKATGILRPDTFADF